MLDLYYAGRDARIEWKKRTRWGKLKMGLAFLVCSPALALQGLYGVVSHYWPDTYKDEVRG